MRLLFCVLMCAVLFSGTFCRAQDVQNSLTAGAWALQFQVLGDFDLAAFDGAMIAVKKHTSPSGAWRLGVDVIVNTTDRNREERTDSGILPERGSESESDREMVALFLQRLFYRNPKSEINLFFGVGPRLGYDRSSVEVHDILDTAVRITKTYRRVWSVGMTGLVGIEWFPHRSISLSGQYATNLVYRNMYESSTTPVIGGEGGTYTSTTDTDTFDLFRDGVRLGLSVYW